MSTIKANFFRSLFILFISVSSITLHAQEAEDSRQEEVLGLTRFYEYMLNTLGSASTVQRDKDVIISESFAKAFINKKVQVEDDLLDERKVITNKDIHAYLRDVDFFFQHVSFKFDSIKITKEMKPNDEVYFLVSYEKTIEGTSLEGNPVRKIQKRFLEVNVNEENSDLKIASVYTTKVDRQKELNDWYNSLSFGWINVFDQYIEYDSITPEVLLQIADIDSINLSNNQFLRNVSPLVALKNLKYINISNTQIEDLSPIRYATYINTIIARNSLVNDLSPLEYFDNIKTLELQGSRVVDIAPLSKLKILKELNLSDTEIVDLEPINALTTLQHLDLSKTEFTDLQNITGLTNLSSLNISKSLIADLAPISSLIQLEKLNVSETSLLNLVGLENHPSLEILNINQTLVSSLDPISNVKTLKKVEADLSGIPEEEAAGFMEIHPNVVVVINSQELRNWWDELPTKWKAIYQNIGKFEDPTKEDLIQLFKLDSLDISNKDLSDLKTPLSKLKKLRFLDISKNPITSLEFLNETTELETLIAKKLSVESVPTFSGTSLEYVNFKGSDINEISGLYGLNNLSFANLDSTNIPDKEIQKLVKSFPEATILWRTKKLQTWWDELDNAWKNAFQLSSPSREELHKLTHMKKVELSGLEIQGFEQLNIFLNLQELSLKQVGILNFVGLGDHTNLSSISCINGPLQSLEGLDKFPYLQNLNVSNTAIEDLQILSTVPTLKSLNCAGTNIKKLRGLDAIQSVEKLDISNTNVFKLDRLTNHSNLKELICFNTRLRQTEVDEFQKKFPNCSITFY